MSPAAIILAALQAARLAIELVEQYNKGDLTDEQLQVQWAAMRTRLGSVSERIRS